MRTFICTILWCCHLVGFGQEATFNADKDLLLAQFDCKTDVDDLHTVAALATLLKNPRYQNVRYYAVAGAYGTQEGPYVPPNRLFELAFGMRWSDAHRNGNLAVQQILSTVEATLDKGGDVWVAEAGQSDFSAQWIRALTALQPNLITKDRIHIVQHSDWNEEVTDKENLEYVKAITDYIKIPDGNAVGNGSPGFRSDKIINWRSRVSDPMLVKVWETAIAIGNTYNGKDGRYLNTSIAAGGLDFSDLSETCYMLGLSELKDAEAFFDFLHRP